MARREHRSSTAARRRTHRTLALVVALVVAGLGSVAEAGQFTGPEEPGDVTTIAQGMVPVARVYSEGKSYGPLATRTPHVRTSGLSSADAAAIQAVVRKIAANTNVRPVIDNSGPATIFASYDRDRSRLSGQGEAGEVVCHNSSCTVREIVLLPKTPSGTEERASLIEHEFLHALGLAHCLDPTSVMYGGDTVGYPTVQGPEYAEVNRLYP